MGFLGNFLLNLGAVAAGRQPRRPLLFSYYLTHRCGLRCGYCSDGEGKKFQDDPVPELDTRGALGLIDLLARSSDTLDITGGEPMVREDLEELLARARERGMRTVLNTKGIGLQGRPGILRLADVLVLGIDTLDPAKLAPIIGRPGEVAAEILENLRFAVREAPAAGTRLVLAAVATPGNLDGVREVLAFAEEHGLGFHLSPEVMGRTANPALAGSDAYRRLLDEVEERKRRGAWILGVPQYLRGIRDFSDFRCHPLLIPMIRPDGRLYYPCLESKRAEVGVPEAGGYEEALRESQRRSGGIPACRKCCYIFCHMAISLLQRHPLAAWREGRWWKRTGRRETAGGGHRVGQASA